MRNGNITKILNTYFHQGLAAEKKKQYHLYAWIIVIVIYMIVFPALFFKGNGYKGGMPCFFVLAIASTAIVLENLERLAAVMLEIMLYTACCLIAYYRPQTVSLSSDFGCVLDVMIGFVISSILLLIAILLRARMFDARHMQIQELNRELEVRNETLLRYDKMKSDFLGTVAHEINTPLAVISASSRDTLDLLKSQSLDIDEITENQMLIEKRVKRIDGIIMDLMDTVAIENGRLPLNRQPLNLSDLLKTVCETHFKKLDVNGNQIIYDCPMDLPHLWVDPDRIEQVMANLLSNAVRHTKDGTITVKLSRADGAQVVSVTDNGEGMDAETARIALKQYVSVKADFWRHGIGLYLCRRIIAAHGGEIWIDSEKGHGTSIFFSLMEAFDYE